MLGGISTPRVDPAATDPAFRIEWYLYFFIAGIATELIVAAVAVFDPLIAEKAAEARIVVIARPPFRWPNQRFVAW